MKKMTVCGNFNGAQKEISLDGLIKCKNEKRIKRIKF